MEVGIVPRSRASSAQRRLATVLGLDWTARSMNFFHAAMASRVLRVFVLLYALCTRLAHRQFHALYTQVGNAVRGDQLERELGRRAFHRLVHHFDVGILEGDCPCEKEQRGSVANRECGAHHGWDTTQHTLRLFGQVQLHERALRVVPVVD